MKVIHCAQRSPEWFALHQHRITSSRFGRVLTGTTRGWRSLMNEMRGPQEFKDISHVPAIGWGVKYEPAARAMFELQRPDVRLTEVGFIVSDCGDYGVSPDGISSRATLEIKCPYNADVHLRTLRYSMVPPEYIAQIQGQMWVAQKRWCWFVSFDPREADHRKLVIIKVARDDEYIKALEERCRSFMFLYKKQIDPESFFKDKARRLF
jgi:putative phage-type endonuclease